MFARPPLRFPDVEAWAVAYLVAALAARPVGETYADNVTVTAYWPDQSMPGRLVVVRDDGGPRVSAVTKLCSLAVNVWAETEEVATDLTLLVAGLLEQAPGNGSVVRHDGATGPARVEESSEKPHRYLTADLVVRGADL